MSESEVEYMDELMEEYGDEYTDKPSKKNEAHYKLTNVLKPYRTTTIPIWTLYDSIINSIIDLEPDYQRDVVWPESKQIALIDSIFRNYYVPPVIFVVHQDDDGTETKTCVDGKQRLTSIQRFMDGHIPHKDIYTGEKFWYKLNPTFQRRHGKLLPDKFRRLFATKQMACVEYSELDDSAEREIFQRVQLGMALTPAEKLQVASSPMTAFVRQLEATYLSPGEPLDSPILDWDRSRGADFRCIAQSLYCIAKYPSTSWGTIPQLEKWLKSPTKGVVKRTRKIATADSDNEEDSLANDADFKEQAEDTFRVFSKLVSDPNLSSEFLRAGWKVSPVEFISIALFISIHKERMPLMKLARRLGAMREHVRSIHVDVRMNGRVAKTLIEFTIKEATEESEVAKKAKRKRLDEDVDMTTARSMSREHKEPRMAAASQAAGPSTHGQTIKTEPGAMPMPSAIASTSYQAQQQRTNFLPSDSPGSPRIGSTLAQSQPQLQPQSQFGSSWLSHSSQPSSTVPPPSRDHLAALRVARENIARASPKNASAGSGTSSPRPPSSAPRDYVSWGQGR